QLQVATGDIVVGPLTALPYSNTNGLYVNNDSGDPNNTFRIDAYANDLAIAGYSGGGAAMGTTITFRTGGPAGGEGNRVRINSSGYVGIGTMGPAYPLDVVGDIHTSGCVMYNGGAVGSCATPSDARLKMNIQPFAPVLDRLVALRPVHYEWNPSNPQKYRYAPGRNPGLIAQEVEAVFPSMVTTGEDGYKKVYYNELPYLLLAGVRELKARNDELKAKVSTLETQNRELTRDVARLRNERSEIAALEARLARLEAISVAGPRQERRAAQKSRPARQRASTEVARVRF
ncbi:MAG TPA: tail fiber domain-containing protein, partial [Terriglobia bacterium]|nr:tail fiber domain-containing protein [Terriglobia bacterium]